MSEEASSRFVRARDINLHYNEAGTGEVLIMLHGSGPGASAWSNFKQNFEVLSQSYRVLLVDQPGYGKSDKPEITEDYFTYSARAVRDMLDTLSIERANFVGNSLGGSTTLRFALDYPDRANQLVLMAPGVAYVHMTSPEPTEGAKHVREFYAPPGPSREKLRAFLEVMVYDDAFVTDELVEERFMAATNPESEQGVANLYKALLHSREYPEVMELWRHLEHIPHPTLLMWGRDDRVVPLDGAFFPLKRLQDARLHVFSKCGHWAQLERREEFERLVVDFLGN